MNIEQLYHIVETARLKSLARAAETLHISQSGLSQSITAFEKELGFPVFNRTRMGAEVTKEGGSIVRLTAQIIELLDEMKKEAEEQTQLLNRKISLAGIPGVMSSFIKLAAYVKQKYPEVSIEMSERGSIDSIKEIEEGRLDAAFVVMNEDMLVSYAGYRFRPVSTGKMVICAGSRSPLATKTSITPDELRKQSVVLYNDDLVHLFMDDFQRQYGSMDVLFSTNNGDAIGMALAENLAVTVGHEYSFYDHPLIRKGEMVTLELEQFKQNPVSFGWLIGNKRKSPLLEECLDTFIGIRRGVL